MKLIIAEKPSMAMDIAAVLKANQRKQGYLEGDNHIVTWCVGHLIELAKPPAYDEKYNNWSISNLPFIPENFKYIISSNTSAQFSVIQSLIHKSSVLSLVNACDAGREGELIFNLVYLMANCRKPVERLWISSLTREDIEKGLRQLQPASKYQGLKDASHARQRADYLISMNATMAFTDKARGKASFNSKSTVFSIGRVQTPTLFLIVEREKEIANFVPEKFYQVTATFYSSVGSYQGLWVGQDGFRLAEESEAKAIAKKVLGHNGVVEKVDKKLVKEKAPLLHDLTSLQRLANTKYGLTANETLKIAQSLYEAKYITYPRTSSQYLSESLAKEITGHLEACNVGVYQQFINQIKSMGIRLTSRHVDNSKLSDHHALLPTTKQVDLSSLEDGQKKIYDLIVRRFLAAFYPESEIEHTTVFTLVLGEKFVSKGKVIIKSGWRVVEAAEATSQSSNKKSSSTSQNQAEDEDKLLPPLKQHQPVETTQADVVEKWTKPPASYTEAALLGAMETAGKQIDDEVLRHAMKDCGLGTPISRTTTIENLIEREYIVRDKKSIKPTEKGKLLIELLPSPLLKSPRLTGEWEKKLSEMAKGNYSFNTFMSEIKQYTKEIVAEIACADIATQTHNLIKEKQPESSISCPKCLIESREGYLVERTGQYGKFLCCSSEKRICNYISHVPKNQKQRKALIESRCPNCEGATKLHFPKEKDRSPVLLCLDYNNCKGIVKLEDANSGSKSNNPGRTSGRSDNNIVKASNSFNNPTTKQFPTQKQTSSQTQEQSSTPKCKVCGKATVKRSFKTKEGEQKYFLGCSAWQRDGNGCDAKAVYIS